MNQRAGGLIVLLVIAVIAFAGGYWFRGWLQVDRCLDAGGRWNHDTTGCEYGDRPGP